MKNKKSGFTLIELLVAILIIALLGGVGVISYQSIFNSNKERYYNVLNSSVLLAATDYYVDHRGELPSGNNYDSVTLSELVDQKYMEQI